MAITVGVLGVSGDGKSTSIVINPDGRYVPDEYKGMNPASTVFINSDKKRPPFPMGDDWKKNTNYFETSDSEAITSMIRSISDKGPQIKSIIIDTVNGIMVDKEMLESRKMSYDKWMN